MRCAWQIQTAPTLSVLSLEQAKRQVSISDELHDDDDDTYRRVRSGTAQVEGYLGRGLLTQTWKYAQDVFTWSMALPMAAPLQSVTSVKYYDTSGVLQTLAATVYQVDTLSEPGRIYLKPNQAWPQLQAGRALAVEVIYDVGWTTPDAVPADIVDAVALLVGDRTAHRENTNVGDIVTEMPNGVEALLAKYRAWWPEPACAV